MYGDGDYTGWQEFRVSQAPIPSSLAMGSLKGLPKDDVSNRLTPSIGWRLHELTRLKLEADGIK